MIIANAKTGQRRAEVRKINVVPSAKMNLFSVIVQFWATQKTEFGNVRAQEGYFGICLLDTDPSDKLKIGDLVNVDVKSFRTSINPNDGTENMQAACLLLNKVTEEQLKREQAVKPEAATA